MGGSRMGDEKTEIDQQKEAARAWFEELRDRICSSFETLETGLPATAPLGDLPPGPLQAHALAAHGSYGV